MLYGITVFAVFVFVGAVNFTCGYNARNGEIEQLKQDNVALAHMVSLYRAKERAQHESDGD